MSGADSLVSFDVDRVLEIARASTDDAVLVVAEVTTTDYRLVHVADAVRERFAAADLELEEVADSFHSYEAIDFFERETFDEMVPTLGGVRAFATFTERAIVVRVLTADEGIYVSVEPGTDVTTLVRELEPVVNGDDPPDAHADDT